MMAVQNLGKAADFKDKVDLHMGVSIRPPPHRKKRGVILETFGMMQIASRMSKILNTKKLAALGELEQGFVFADKSATYKEMASMFGQPEVGRGRGEGEGAWRVT